MHKTFPTKPSTRWLFKVLSNLGCSVILFVKSRIYLVLKCYLVHLKLFLLFLQSTILKKNIRNSKYLSYFTRQAAMLYKYDDRATEKSQTKGVAAKSLLQERSFTYSICYTEATLQWTGPQQNYFLVWNRRWSVGWTAQILNGITWSGIINIW